MFFSGVDKLAMFIYQKSIQLKRSPVIIIERFGRQYDRSVLFFLLKAVSEIHMSIQKLAVADDQICFVLVRYFSHQVFHNLTSFDFR